MKPLISVIVPVYNIMEYLPRCVESICRQTYEELEILLVDDGSTDATGELCDRLAEKDTRIRVFHKPNGGTSSARNLGLRQAKGSFVGFVDSDDYIELDMYENLMAAVSDGVQIVQCGRDETDEQGNQLPFVCVPPKQKEEIPAEDFLRELLMHRGDCSFCTKLVQRELFENKGFPEGKLNEDFILLVELLLEAKAVVSLPTIGYHVFYKSNSNSRKTDRESFSRVYADCVDNADKMEELTATRYAGLKKTARRFAIFQRLEYLLHIPVSQMTRGNGFYRKNVVSYLRKHVLSGLTNPYLTAKNKLYLILFVISPKGIRKLHWMIKGKSILRKD